jgi:AcrR family transcriptional regulator
MNYYEMTEKLSPKTRKTFDKIVKCAKKEFSKRGYSNTSIHAIAEKAKLSVGCLYKYFGSKDELYYFIIHNEQRMIREYLNHYISFCPTREDKEREGLRAWLYYVRENPGVYKLIWETLFIDKKAFDKYYSTFTESYTKALFGDKDQLKMEDFENVSYILIGISNFLGIILINSDSKATDEEIKQMVDTGMAFLKNGLFK